MLSTFSLDFWDKLWVLTRSVLEVSLLIQFKLEGIGELDNWNYLEGKRIIRIFSSVEEFSNGML